MEITEYVCQALPDVCVVLRFIKIVTATLLLGILTAVPLFMVGSYMRKKEHCPKCKKGVLKETAFIDQVPTLGPGKEKGIYRRSYKTCSCGYSESRGELEYIGRAKPF